MAAVPTLCFTNWAGRTTFRRFGLNRPYHLDTWALVVLPVAFTTNVPHGGGILAGRSPTAAYHNQRRMLRWAAKLIPRLVAPVLADMTRWTLLHGPGAAHGPFPGSDEQLRGSPNGTPLPPVRALNT